MKQESVFYLKKMRCVIKKIKDFFKNVINELKKVRWPDKKYIIKYTIVTLVFVFVVAMYFFGWSALMAFLKSLLRG